MSITNINEIYTTKIDEYSSDVTYVGLADVGTSSSDSHWQIKKIVTSGTITSIQFANGDSSFNNVWDNRVSLSYS